MFSKQFVQQQSVQKIVQKESSEQFASETRTKKNFITKPLTTALLLAGALPFTFSNSVAQEAALLDEIIVTSQKRSQSVQDIGISINAKSGDELRDQGVTNVDDLTKIVPGMGMFDVSGGVPVVIIRGVGLQNFRVNDTPTTSFYIDEIYQTSVAMAGFSMFDLDRVEVLKGPQGGLYGRNAVGGAVQVISKKPDTQNHSGYVQLDAGKWDTFAAEGAFGGPISDSIAGRIAGRIEQSDDTYFHSTTGNFDHGEKDKWGLRGQLLFDITDNVEVLAKVHAGEDTSELPLLRPIGVYQPINANIVPLFADGALFNYGGVAPSISNICSAVRNGGRDDAVCESANGQTLDELNVNGPHESASDFISALDNQWHGASINAKVDIGGLTFTSITAYDSFEHGRDVDFDAVAEIQQHIDYNSEFEVWSQEFRLSSDTSEALRWLVGLNYAQDELIEDTTLIGTSGLLPLAFSGATEAYQPYEQESKMVSAFGRLDFDVTDMTTLVFETRYTKEEKSFDGGVTVQPVNIFISYLDDSTDFSDVSGKIGVEHRLANDALLFVNLSKGYKSGGYFGGFATSTDQLEPFDKEDILAFEVGLKSELLDRRLRLNTSAYYYDRRDVQANATDVSAVVPISKLSNIGDVKTYGAELEMDWLISDAFFLQAGLAYVNSEITDSDLFVGDIYATGLYSLEGQTPANTPEYNANLVANYTAELNSDWLAKFQLEYSYRSEQSLAPIAIEEEESVLLEPAYGLLNFRMTLDNLVKGLTFSAWAENLTDEEYRLTAGDNTLGGFFEIYGSPRTWGLGVDVDF